MKFEWSNCGKILAVGGYQVTYDTRKNLSSNKSNSNNNNSREPCTKSKIYFNKKSTPTTAAAANANTMTKTNSEYNNAKHVTVTNFVHFYNTQGVLLFKIQIPSIVSFFSSLLINS